MRENLSLNVNAFPILAKLNIPQIQAFTRGVAEGGFSEIPTSEARALFTDGFKTEAGIRALNALDELLKQLSEQQAILAVAQTNVNNNFAPLLTSQALSSADFEVSAGVSSSLVAEVESAGFVVGLMTQIPCSNSLKLW